MFVRQWLIQWKREGRLQKSERKSIRNRAQQHNEGPWEGQRHRQGGPETACRSFKLQGWTGAIQCQRQRGHFLELSCIKGVVREALTLHTTTLQSVSTTPSLRTHSVYLLDILWQRSHGSTSNSTTEAGRPTARLASTGTVYCTTLMY